MKFIARCLKFKVYHLQSGESHMVGKKHSDNFNFRFGDGGTYYYNSRGYDYSILCGEDIPTEGDRYVLMQYTGCNDSMTQEELYEYDVVHYDGMYGVIVFENGAWRVSWAVKPDNLENVLYDYISTGYLQKVGNYFEDPNLQEYFEEG